MWNMEKEENINIKPELDIIATPIFWISIQFDTEGRMM